MLDMVREIQAVALTVEEAPANINAFFEIQELPDWYSGMSRPLWHPTEGVLQSGPLKWRTAKSGSMSCVAFGTCRKSGCRR